MIVRLTTSLLPRAASQSCGHAHEAQAFALLHAQALPGPLEKIPVLVPKLAETPPLLDGVVGQIRSDSITYYGPLH